jgi:phenylpropionate dioxygenase-like ring-hydroxylating dioxygenase large terminal subunit
MKNNLPQEAYTDAAFFLLELEHIFSKTWAFAGLKEDVVNVGDYITVQAGLNNIIVIMDSNEQLSAFHNICRHRGTRLVEGKGNLKNRISCPYHDWSYSLAGDLQSLPKQRKEFPQMDKSCLGLKKAQVAIFKGMIWVHPDLQAESADNWFSAIAQYLGPHDVESLIESKENIVVENIQANWKIVVENYIDHYHLAQLHSGTLNMYDHNKAEFGFVGHHFKFWEPLTKEYLSNISKNSPLPLIQNAEDEKIGAWVPMLFPGIGLAETECSWSVFHIIPYAVDKTKVIIRTKVKDCATLEYVKQGIRSASYWSKKVRPKNSSYNKKHPLGSGDFLQEDIYICEQLQKSFSSPYFEFGPSATIGESPIRELQQLTWEIIKPYWQD